jgi:hypothetical protein
MLEYENAFLLAFILSFFHAHSTCTNNTMCVREKERKNEVNVPPSEVTLTSRRAHFLLIASIPISSFTRESFKSVQLPPLLSQQLSHHHHHHQHHHLTLPVTTQTTTTILPHHTSRAHHYYSFIQYRYGDDGDVKLKARLSLRFIGSSTA